MIENVTDITKDQLLGEVQKMKYDGYRFVTATCIDNGDETLDVYYHFDKDYELKNFKLKLQRNEEISSISKIYLCSVLVENEMSELFGVKVSGMAIDYGGHMLLADDSPDNPMARNQIVIEQKGAK
ncbi:MAG: NADH-quinone oxidoreductase subunit C [Bacillota bacterium]|nr:NADH-quinone oxidoreductase subunit C [Bacillota bacterium]